MYSPREILFEFKKISRFYVKVSAIDPSTLKEAVVFVRSRTPRATMQQRALEKLLAVSDQKAKKNASEHGSFKDRRSGWHY